MSFLFCIIIFLLIVILFTKSFLLGLVNIRFRPLSTKNFQAKIKQVADMTAKLLLPRAHSGGPGEVGEQLPPWVTNLAVWVSEDRISIGDMIVSIEHLINN